MDYDGNFVDCDRMIEGFCEPMTGIVLTDDNDDSYPEYPDAGISRPSGSGPVGGPGYTGNKPQPGQTTLTDSRPPGGGAYHPSNQTNWADTGTFYGGNYYPPGVPVPVGDPVWPPPPPPDLKPVGEDEVPDDDWDAPGLLEWYNNQYVDTVFTATNPPPTCELSHADNYLVMGVLDLSTILVTFGLPPLPSLDQIICKDDKRRVLNNVIEMLSELAGDNISVMDGFSDILEGGQYIVSSLANNFADLAAAAIEFGRGNFGATIMELLESIPGWGNLIGEIFEKIGLDKVIDWSLSFISDSDKEKIKDLVVNGLALAAAIPNPFTPVLVPMIAMVTSAIMFGRHQWDEAIGNLLMLGLGKAGEKLFGVLKKIKPNPNSSISKAMKKVTDALLKMIMPLVRKIRKPILKAAQKYNLLDYNWKLTDNGKRRMAEASFSYKAYGLGDTVQGFEDDGHWTEENGLMPYDYGNTAAPLIGSGGGYAGGSGDTGIAGGSSGNGPGPGF